MIITQIFFPSPLFFPVYDLVLQRFRCNWESSIFRCDHDRKIEEIGPYMTLSLMASMICAIGRTYERERKILKISQSVGANDVISSSLECK